MTVGGSQLIKLSFGLKKIISGHQMHISLIAIDYIYLYS